MSDPVASVVMSVFNGERFLREAIDSILSQSFSDFEFIIINDGSTDRTFSILQSYEKSDPRVRVHEQENKGLPESLNRGCGLAQGKYIVRMDADDVSTPYRIERQIGFLENHEKVGLLGGALEVIDAQGKRLFLDRPLLEDEPIRAAFRSFSFPLNHPAVVMRKQAFDASGGYRAQFMYAEDNDLWLRIIERWRVANLADVVLRKRIHPTQVSVCHLRQQVLSLLGAYALSLARQRHSVEPPHQEPVISEEFLEKLGVSQASRQGALASAYAAWMGSMSQISQDDAVLQLFEETIALSRSGPLPRSALSDGMLWAARTYYRQGRFARSVFYLGRAVLARPIVAGRPLKRALKFLFRKSQAYTD
jgi:hypothetical protein